MKIIDCFMFFDEKMMLDIRLNILDKHVSHFIICEATYNHRGKSKRLNFNINDYSKFKDKISYIILDKQPNDLRIIKDTDTENIRNSKILDNAVIRENYQRNYVTSQLNNFSEDDLILINDLDEIPNLDNFKHTNKITVFKQKMIYYKLNLVQPNFSWTGSKICKKKYLKSPQWLRNIKSKKYPIWRLDSFFSNKKYNDITFIKDGGWHFTNIKSVEEIDYKMKNFLHHLEYEKSGLKISDLKKMKDEKRILYNYNIDQKGYKWSDETKLELLGNNSLPEYITRNFKKYEDWLE
jgi:beta-1,4-mannosyl-glycoprotein beta-1,4-N-acetylglucosaminyltransferase